MQHGGMAAASDALKQLQTPGRVGQFETMKRSWVRGLLQKELGLRGDGAAEASGHACPICQEQVLTLEEASYYGCRCVYVYHESCALEASLKRQLKCPTCNSVAPHLGNVLADLRLEERSPQARSPPSPSQPRRAALDASASRADWITALRLLSDGELRSLAQSFGLGQKQLRCQGCRAGFQSFQDLCLLSGCRHRRSCYHRACADLAGACEICGAASAVLAVHQALLEGARRMPRPSSPLKEAPPPRPERAFRFAAPCFEC